jgi:aryl-alcohol dehydrogenase-like predicted oxidoreductase
METMTAAAAGTIRIGGDLLVNRLGYGAMRLCGPGVWGWPDDRENALHVLRRAVELDVTFIDTAEAYGPYVNEEQIAQALYPYREGLVIATKGGTTRQGPGEWGRDGRPERIKEACEGSLRRLKRSQIDLYQLHAVDPNVPREEQVGALRDLRDAGKIRHAGLSNVTLDQLKSAEKVVPIASVQNRYNASYRESDPIVDYCESREIAFLPWFPLEAGDIGENDELKTRAEREGVTVHQMAIAWLLARSPVMLPIPGTSSVRHLEENIRAAAVRLR